MQEFFARLNNNDYGATGFFAPKPIFDQRQAFILYTSAQPNIVEAEAKLAAEADTQYKGYKGKYERSRDTVTRTGEPPNFVDQQNFSSQKVSVYC